MNKLYSVFSNDLKQHILSVDFKRITEIRMRINRPLIINTIRGEMMFDDLIINENHLFETFNAITDYSAYAYENAIKNGYITLEGGHRVGLGGEVFYENGEIKSFKNIKFLNFRISHFIKDCGVDLLESILNQQELLNTVIISKPGMGKTTLLRDLIRLISNSIEGTSISVIDERNEISGSYNGTPYIDLGTRTDVIVGTEKSQGIILAIRAMAPEIIAVDEIGSEKDIEALNYAKNSGVKIIATIHGNSKKDVLKKIGQADFFDKYVIIKEKGVYQLC